MDQQRRSLLVARLSAGFVPVKPGDAVYHLRDAGPAERLAAEEAHLAAIAEAEDLLTDEAAVELATSDGAWDSARQKKLSLCEAELDDLRVALYEAFHDPQKRDEVREKLRECRSAVASLLESKWRYRDQTAGAFAAARKARVVAGLCLYTPAGGRAFGDDHCLWADGGVLDAVVEEAARHRPSEVELRELARTSPWQGYWAVGKPNPFGGPATHLGDDRLALCNYSMMYDRVDESPDRPPRDVVADDDALDGWLILQRRKAGTDDKEEKKRKMIGSEKIAANYIFIFHWAIFHPFFPPLISLFYRQAEILPS